MGNKSKNSVRSLSGVERHELATMGRIAPLVNLLEIRSLPAEPRPVVDHLELNLSSGVVNARHTQLRVQG